MTNIDSELRIPITGPAFHVRGPPDRYRAVVYAAAEQILRDLISGESSEADSNEAFRASYPEYFDQPGAAPNTRHQRLLRVRADTRALLQAAISKASL